MTRTFPHFTLRGSHREVGRQHGEALRSLIRAHLELIYTQGAQKSQLTPEALGPGWITALRTAASSGDSATLFRVAHGVTGAVGYFKAAGVRQAAADLEAMGREGRLKDVPTMVDRLQVGLVELSTFLGSAPWRP